jgi:CubicO group peptidase (beta-lactamase class C family)
MTKPIVTASAMVLVELGLLRLDHPVEAFIPSFANLRVMQADGTQVPARQAPTVQDLMAHCWLVLRLFWRQPGTTGLRR